MKTLTNLFEQLDNDHYFLKNWSFDYQEALDLQYKCAEYVSIKPKTVFLITCAHPHCFTLGKGLQKTLNAETPLVDFVHDTPLSYPLYKIKRGGGLTFHYPGQFVCYPILNLTYHRVAVFDLMIKMLNIANEILQAKFCKNNFVIRRDLLGLWSEDERFNSKLASIGIAVSKYITNHGMALNLYDDLDLFRSISNIHPCGINGSFYTCVERIARNQLNTNYRDEFSNLFTQQFFAYLMQDKQRSSSAQILSISS